MTSPRIIAALVAVAVAALLPQLTGPYGHFLLAMVLIYALVGLSFTVLLGIGGQISIGHAAFWALGAYGSAILVTKLGVPFLLAVLGGAVVAGAFGLVVALPALRVQGHYLAIATLGLSVVVQQVLFEWTSLTGGRQGMLVPRPELLGTEIWDDGVYCYILLPFVLLAILLVHNFRVSMFGSGLAALRMSAIAARSAGVGRGYHLIIAFVLSAFLTGLSGAFYGHLLGQLSTNSFTLNVSLGFLTMAVIGGLSSISGALLGAAFLAVVPELLRGAAEAQTVLYGALLILCMRFLPGGLASLPARLSVLSARLRRVSP